MTSFKNILRAAAFGVAMVAAAAVPTQKAQAADRGDVIAGVAGGLLVGTLFAAAANASNNHYAPQTYAAPAQPQYYAPAQTYSAPAQTYYAPAPAQTYYAPAPTYYAPAPRYYAPSPVTLSFGFSSGRHYGHRRHYRGHKHRYHRRHHRAHRHHRRHHRH